MPLPTRVALRLTVLWALFGLASQQRRLFVAVVEKRMPQVAVRELTAQEWDTVLWLDTLWTWGSLVVVAGLLLAVLLNFRLLRRALAPYRAAYVAAVVLNVTLLVALCGLFALFLFMPRGAVLG